MHAGPLAPNRKTARTVEVWAVFACFTPYGPPISAGYREEMHIDS